MNSWPEKASGLVAMKLSTDEIVDLGLGHDDLAIDLAFAQPRHEDIVADLLAKTLPGHAIGLEAAPQRVLAQIVVTGDARDRPRQRGLVRPQRALFGELTLDALDDQTLEHLALQHLSGRLLHALATELHDRLFDPVAQLDPGDDFLVHDRNHAVHFGAALRMRARGRKQCGKAHARQGYQTVEGRNSHGELNGIRLRLTVAQFPPNTRFEGDSLIMP